MTDITAQAEMARRRFAETDTGVLREMWSADGRMDWAELALRGELMNRGIGAGELDAIAARRAEIARDAPPSVRDTLWLYGLVGRVATLCVSVLAFLLLRAIGGAGMGLLGVVIVLSAYVFVLLRRTQLQQKHPAGNAATFAMAWQVGEACLILLGFVVAMLFAFLG
ncbi:MAG TPA: hypothetical protein VGO76_07590 [Luteibacter sp.]|jgi:hypothetical protein|nr:hypothetical protein [Luteibacter sp.]